MTQTQNDSKVVQTLHYYLVPKFNSLADVDEFFNALAENKIPPAGEYTLTEYAEQEEEGGR